MIMKRKAMSMTMMLIRNVTIAEMMRAMVAVMTVMIGVTTITIAAVIG